MPAVAPWSLRVDVHHHGARSAALKCHEPEAEAEIAARDAPVALKPRRDARNGRRWDDEHAPAGPEYRHADGPADWVDGETAFGTPPQAQIKLDPSVDLATPQGAPKAFRAGHHAERGGRRALLGTHRYGERADRDGCCLSGTGRRSERSTRSNATSVVGSRPTSCAGTVSPPESVTVYSPSSDKASSAVTMSPGRQTKPLERER